MKPIMDDNYDTTKYDQAEDYSIEENNTQTKSKKSLKKEQERAVRSKLSRIMEKKRLRNEFDDINGWS